ncbi:hypothetical protein EYC84_009584 [Monilinia fructicola]|uniref:Uncharacterized protein n=1 Tax=Monilinia fructicola TaxID=38448 RepID=A0A5M9JAY3_MONFR|nr:hypothetical protein EYC84_009584 [Monilinia fructicola]
MFGIIGLPIYERIVVSTSCAVAKCFIGLYPVAEYLLSFEATLSSPISSSPSSIPSSLPPTIHLFHNFFHYLTHFSSYS